MTINFAEVALANTQKARSIILRRPALQTSGFKSSWKRSASVFTGLHSVVSGTMASSGLGTAGRPWRAVFVSCRPPRTLRSSVLYKPVGIKAGLCKWQPLSPRGLVRLAAAEPSTATGRQAPVTKKALRSHTKVTTQMNAAAVEAQALSKRLNTCSGLASRAGQVCILSRSGALIAPW